MKRQYWKRVMLSVLIAGCVLSYTGKAVTHATNIQESIIGTYSMLYVPHRKSFHPRIAFAQGGSFRAYITPRDTLVGTYSVTENEISVKVSIAECYSDEGKYPALYFIPIEETPYPCEIALKISPAFLDSWRLLAMTDVNQEIQADITWFGKVTSQVITHNASTYARHG